MVETPRSAKRRRLDPTSPSPNEQTTTVQRPRRSAQKKSTATSTYDVIEITENPVYDVTTGHESKLYMSTPSKRGSKKGKLPQSPRPIVNPTGQATPRTPQNKSRQDAKKSLATPDLRQEMVQAVSDGEDELALPTKTASTEADHDMALVSGKTLERQVSESLGDERRSGSIKKSGSGKKASARAKRKPVQEELAPSAALEIQDNMDIDEDNTGTALATNDTRPLAQDDSKSMLTLTSMTHDHLSICKNIVLSKLAQRRPILLKNLDPEYTKVHQLLHATVTAGESNSLLLIGARGSGKTAMINAALNDLSQSQKEHFHTIRLNGFIQTDDKLALREIWRQLGREMEISDAEDSGGKSYADTLAMLLALLSHPDEIAGKASDGSSVAKSVVFIMDEFDLFATHARQTLLYNLLDIAQSRKAPIAVIGLTTRIDVTEALEKRVKSRFSHRYVHIGLAKTISEFVDVGKAALMVAENELTIEERATVTGSANGVKSASNAKKTAKASDQSSLELWNTAVEALFTSASFLKTYVHPIYYTTKSASSLFSNLLMFISMLNGLPDPSQIASSATLLTPPDSSLHILPYLSELALSLLIAAARLSIIHSTDTTNFPLAYAEYVSLASKARINSAASGALASGAGTRVFGKEAARREWEKLVGHGLMVPVASGAFGLGGTGSSGKWMEMVRVDVALEEIPQSVELNAVMEKWCQQI